MSRVNACKISAVLLPLAVLELAAALLVWAGIGFDRQVVHHWATTSGSLHLRTQRLVAGHHSRGAIISVAAFLALVYALLISFSVALGRWAWKGYP